MSVRVLLVDDNAALRTSVRALLEADPHVTAVVEAADGAEAVARATECRPHVVLMDVALPVMSGAAATERILKANPDVRVLGLSVYSHRSYVARMLVAGASGYLLKDDVFEELSGALRAILEGRLYLSPVIASEVVERFLRKLAVRSHGAGPALSANERQVLQLLAEGRSAREMALPLGVKPAVATAMRNALLSKLGMASANELAEQFAGQCGGDLRN